MKKLLASVMAVAMLASMSTGAFADNLDNVPYFRMRMLLFLSRLQKAESVSARLKNLEVVPGQPLPEKIWKITRIL